MDDRTSGGDYAGGADKDQAEGGAAKDPGGSTGGDQSSTNADQSNTSDAGATSGADESAAGQSDGSGEVEAD